MELPGTGGSFTECSLRYTYIRTVATPGTTSAPIQQGDGIVSFISEITAPYLPSPAHGAVAANGSRFVDTITGQGRTRIGGSWVVQS